MRKECSEKSKGIFMPQKALQGATRNSILGLGPALSASGKCRVLLCYMTSPVHFGTGQTHTKIKRLAARVQQHLGNKQHIFAHMESAAVLWSDGEPWEVAWPHLGS
jgi:hypothetical protein